jgi:ppGpp synthetase/RelA/SpoT-type nucleotidyltranferase
MDFIDQFIARYRREFDFFEQAGRLVAQQLDARLQASGIRAMVTSRAKAPRRLEDKIRQRAGARTYASVDDIHADIVDLAGVRVALYFPGERREVDKIVSEQFALTAPPKLFTGTSNPSYEKRFSGYWATHYRLQLRAASLPDASQRYADAKVEVQVASVLMHAWAEVEHDLVYKPLQGDLSEDELAILDELNGMVLTGEIALERLQRAAEWRVKHRGARFANHYDLASFLLEAARPILQDGAEPVLGNVELLFRFLKHLEIVTPETLRPYVESLSPDTERRPVAQQITDQVLLAEPTRYELYERLRMEWLSKDVGTAFVEYTDHGPAHLERAHAALGLFITEWIKFERFLRFLTESRFAGTHIAPATSPKSLQRLDVFTQRELAEIDHLRRTRNLLVHGIEVPDAEYISEAGRAIEAILARLAADPQRDIRHAAQLALGIELN